MSASRILVGAVQNDYERIFNCKWPNITILRELGAVFSQSMWRITCSKSTV